MDLLFDMLDVAVYDSIFVGKHNCWPCAPHAAVAVYDSIFVGKHNPVKVGEHLMALFVVAFLRVNTISCTIPPASFGCLYQHFVNKYFCVIKNFTIS